MPRLRIAAVLAVFLLASLGLAAQETQPPTGPVVIPKTAPNLPNTEAPPPTPQQQQQQQQQPAPQKPQFNYSLNVPDVEIPVTVQTSTGQFVPNLTATQFQLYEDGVPQKIDHVGVTNDAPMTVVLLIEFRRTWAPFLYNILTASYAFTGQLQSQDWVALVTYDIKPHIVVDFTQNKQAIYQGLNSLDFLPFSETDLFDSLSDTIDRLNGVQGHKTIVLISTGADTFSSLTFGDLQKKLQATQGITIYCVSMNWTLEQWLGGGLGAQMTQLSLDQADAELGAIAGWTGGHFYEPRFEGAYNQVFQQIAGAVRSQYTLSYSPTNKAMDGTKRTVKIELVGPTGKPLKMVDQKGKPVKYTVSYRSSYVARHVVE